MVVLKPDMSMEPFYLLWLGRYLHNPLSWHILVPSSSISVSSRLFPVWQVSSTCNGRHQERTNRGQALLLGQRLCCSRLFCMCTGRLHSPLIKYLSPGIWDSTSLFIYTAQKPAAARGTPTVSFLWGSPLSVLSSLCFTYPSHFSSPLWSSVDSIHFCMCFFSLMDTI